MNLIQIQERLKEVPLNAVIAYANGSNPEVPPYLALAEIQRRNKVQESSQTAMPPDSSVKEQIERKAMEQSANQLMVDQGRQQQAAQQLTQQMGQQMQQVPQNVPQPEVPEVGMAGGGIASVPVGDMFKFDGGGIVAFADGGTDEVDNPFQEVKTKSRTRVAQTKKQERPREPAKPTYLQEAESRIRELSIPEMQSPREALAEAAKTSPNLQRPAQTAYEEALRARSEQDIKDQKAFEAREEEAARRNLWNSLIAAGEATRGGGGIGRLLGGFGRSYGTGEEAASERRARQEAQRREQALNMAKLNAEIENARRAEERGDVEAQRRHLENIAKLKFDLGMKQADMFKDLAQLQQTGEYQKGYLDVMLEQTRRAGAQQTPEFIRLVEYFKSKNPNLTNEQAYEMAVRYSRQGIAGEYGMDKANAQIIQKIQEKYRMQLDMARQSKNKSQEEQIMRQMEDDIRRATGGISFQQPAQSTPSGFTVTREK